MAGREQACCSTTREWDGFKWTQVVADSQPGSPPRRALHGLAYDEKRGKVVLTAGFGGFDAVARKPTTYGDTWEQGGATWRRIDTPGPGARDHVEMVYAPDRAAIVLHGGGTAEGGLGGDTWTYDGARWTRLLDNGPRRGRHRLAYDPLGRRVLLYGGWAPASQQMTELWELRANTIAWHRKP